MTRIVMMIGRELYLIYVIAYLNSSPFVAFLIDALLSHDVNDYLPRESALLQA